MSSYSSGHARRGVFHTAIFRAVSQACTLASYVVLVRSMSEHTFGVLSLLYAAIPVMSTVASFGIEHTLKRFQPEYLTSGRPEAAKWLLRISSTTRLVSNVLLIALVLLLWDWIAPTFKLGPYRREFLLFSVLILLHFQSSILQLSLSSQMLLGHAGAMIVVLSATKLIAYVILAATHELTLVTAIMADTLAYLLMYTGLRIVHYKYGVLASVKNKFKPDATERKRLLRFSFFNNFNDAGTLLLTSASDSLFIGALMNPVAAGTYSFYSRLNEMGTQLLPIRQFGSVIQPIFFGVKSGEAAARIPRYFTLLTNLTMLVQWPLLAFALAFHHEIVMVVFHGKFAQYSWLLPLMMTFATLNRFNEPVSMVIQYEEKSSILLLSKVFAIYNAVAVVVLIKVAGIYGAAIANGTGQLLKNLFVWWHVRKIAVWVNLRALILSSLLIWGGAVGLCYLMKTLLAAPMLVHMALGVVICTIAMLLYVRSPALSTSDRQLLASVFHGRERRILAAVGIVR
jgi:O-antigen/teichoic acid export membrane protein